MQNFNRKLILENGSVYFGAGFGAAEDVICEAVFNTSMVGYQEIVSDPSYTGQAVVMTYPIIGNYGITDEDFETKTPTIGALIVREYNDNPSNFRYTKTLSELMVECGVPGISGVDTRKLTREIRDVGSMKCLITSVDAANQCVYVIEQSGSAGYETPIAGNSTWRVDRKITFASLYDNGYIPISHSGLQIG